MHRITKRCPNARSRRYPGIYFPDPLPDLDVGRDEVMPALAEWKEMMLKNNICLFPDTPNTDKEYIAGYLSAKIGSIYERKQARLTRDKLVKNMRSDGWQTWTEPESHIGGSDTMEYSFSAARTITRTLPAIQPPVPMPQCERD